MVQHFWTKRGNVAQQVAHCLHVSEVRGLNPCYLFNSMRKIMAVLTGPISSMSEPLDLFVCVIKFRLFLSSYSTQILHTYHLYKDQCSENLCSPLVFACIYSHLNPYFYSKFFVWRGCADSIIPGRLLGDITTQDQVQCQVTKYT